MYIIYKHYLRHRHVIAPHTYPTNATAPHTLVEQVIVLSSHSNQAYYGFVCTRYVLYQVHRLRRYIGSSTSHGTKVLRQISLLYVLADAVPKQMSSITTTQTTFTTSSKDNEIAWLQYNEGELTQLVLNAAFPDHVGQQVRFNRIIYQDLGLRIRFDYQGDQSYEFNNVEMEVEVDDTLAFIALKVTGQGVDTTLHFQNHG